jgi:hypothetical protein
MDGAVVRMKGEKLIPEGKGPLGRRSHRWEDCTKVDVKEKWCENVD